MRPSWPQPMVSLFGGPPWARLLPGLALTVAIGLVSVAIQALEERLIGHAVIESLVIAILLGMLWRTRWGMAAHLQPGVSFTAATVLEVAIVLLGASVDFPALLQSGPTLLLAVIGVVAVGIVSSATIGRLIGLNPKLALLVACGNAICGNSAIAAVAPVIHADAEDVASAIALTAVLGVVVVLGLPLLIPLLHMSFYQYGVLAGMTVYAVPQVLAATFSVSPISGQIGTLVKLIRVLLLGPVVLTLSLREGIRAGGQTIRLSRLVPWFIIGFLCLGVARSVGLLPALVADPLRAVSRWLTVAAMAALGLGVDIRAVRRVGLPVASAVVASLAVMIGLSITLIAVLRIGG